MATGIPESLPGSCKPSVLRVKRRRSEINSEYIVLQAHSRVTEDLSEALSELDLLRETQCKRRRFRRVKELSVGDYNVRAVFLSWDFFVMTKRERQTC
uniref:Uncharacterized protein n=1 Tax=Tetraselmis sp. GSL018 TaxID=582737 RepID=A0A061S1U7_9CHLO